MLGHTSDFLIAHSPFSRTDQTAKCAADALDTVQAVQLQANLIFCNTAQPPLSHNLAASPHE